MLDTVGIQTSSSEALKEETLEGSKRWEDLSDSMNTHNSYFIFFYVLFFVLDAQQSPLSELMSSAAQCEALSSFNRGMVFFLGYEFYSHFLIT